MHRVGIFTTRYHQTNELFGNRLGANGCSAVCCSALLSSQSIIKAKSRRASQFLVHVIVYRLYLSNYAWIGHDVTTSRLSNSPELYTECCGHIRGLGTPCTASDCFNFSDRSQSICTMHRVRSHTLYIFTSFKFTFCPPIPRPKQLQHTVTMILHALTKHWDAWLPITIMDIAYRIHTTATTCPHPS
jgi:hypothetical protein